MRTAAPLRYVTSDEVTSPEIGQEDSPESIESREPPDLQAPARKAAEIMLATTTQEHYRIADAAYRGVDVTAPARFASGFLPRAVGGERPAPRLDGMPRRNG